MLQTVLYVLNSGSKRSQRSTPKNSPRYEKESFPSVSSPRTMVESVPAGGMGTSHGPADVRPTDRLTPTDFLVEEIMGESDVLNSCPSGNLWSMTRQRVISTYF